MKTLVRLSMLMAIWSAFAMFNLSLAADFHVVKGKITDAESGEPLVGVNILAASGRGAVTDLNGNFILSLQSGLNTLYISYVSMQSDTLELLINCDTILQIALSPMVLSEITIIGKRKRSSLSLEEDGVVSITGAQLDKLPTVFGEKELLRAIQLLPGVQSGNEGARGIFVRGGGPDQNLMLYEGAPVYNVAHLYGVFSVFNSDIVGKADLHKNYLPPRLGGRLASVVEVDARPARMDSLQGGLQVGMFTSKVYADVPIIKDKLSFQTAVRGCYAGLLSGPISARQFESANENGRLTYFFYDINAALYANLSEKHQLEWHLFRSDDIFKLNDKWQSNPDATINNVANLRFVDEGYSVLRWNNLSTSFRWNALINEDWTYQQDVYWSKYQLKSTENDYERFENTDTILNGVLSNFINKSTVAETGLKGNFNWKKNQHQLNLGYSAILRQFNTGNGDIFEQRQGLLPVNIQYGDPNQSTGELDGFASYRLQSSFLTLDFGGRLNYFKAYDGFDKLSFQPRGMLEINLPKRLVWQMTGAYTVQNLHLLASSAGDILNDIWVPANGSVRPENAIQGGAGLRQQLKNGYTWSVDGFYRKINGLIEYNEGASYLIVGRDWQRQVASDGEGRVYGLELFAAKTTGKLTAWAKYTWSKSERQFDVLNRGQWFPYKYDRTHDASFTVNYVLNKKLDISLSWVYGSGNTFTLSTVQYPALSIRDYYEFVNDEEIYLNGTSSQIRYFESRNNYRLKAFHHLDIGMNYRWSKGKAAQVINVSVYNIYNRLNVFNVYLDWKLEADGQYSISYKTLSIMPIMPSFSYAITF